MTFPPDFTFPKEKTTTAQVAALKIADLASERRSVVQAGGCAGLWPVALAQYFDQVYTFEPEPTNFAYLQANVAAWPNVFACQAALGETSRGVSLSRTQAKAGCWSVAGDGDIPMLPLDDVVGDVAIDAIVLDVEGYEVPAFLGAARLITTQQPLLWFEFTQHTAAIEALLADYGYRPPTRGVGGDCYSVHTSRT